MANRPRTRLHVPQPPARPGDRADFSYLKLQPAGAQPRPDVKVSAEPALMKFWSKEAKERKDEQGRYIVWDS